MGNARSVSASACTEDRVDNRETQILNTYQKLIIRTAWRHMSKSGQGNCGGTVMKRLCLKEPNVKKGTIGRRPIPPVGEEPVGLFERLVFQAQTVLGGMFGSGGSGEQQTLGCGMRQHNTEIVKFLHFVINNMDHPSKIAVECHKIGMNHRKQKEMGLKSEYWDLLGESITETISFREYQGWRRHRQSLRAANILISFIVDRIRAGFNQRDALFAHLRPILKVSVDPKALQEADTGLFSNNTQTSDMTANQIESEHTMTSSTSGYRSRMGSSSTTGNVAVTNNNNVIPIPISQIPPPKPPRSRSIGVQTQSSRERPGDKKTRHRSCEPNTGDKVRFSSWIRDTTGNDPNEEPIWRKLPPTPPTPPTPILPRARHPSTISYESVDQAARVHRVSTEQIQYHTGILRTQSRHDWDSDIGLCQARRETRFQGPTTKVPQPQAMPQRRRILPRQFSFNTSPAHINVGTFRNSDFFYRNVEAAAFDNDFARRQQQEHNYDTSNYSLASSISYGHPGENRDEGQERSSTRMNRNYNTLGSGSEYPPKTSDRRRMEMRREFSAPNFYYHEEENGNEDCFHL